MTKPKPKPPSTRDLAIEATRALHRSLTGRDAGETITLQDLAALAGCDHRTTRRAIKAGTLRASERGWRYVVTIEDAALWLVSRGAI